MPWVLTSESSSQKCKTEAEAFCFEQWNLINQWNQSWNWKLTRNRFLRWKIFNKKDLIWCGCRELLMKISACEECTFFLIREKNTFIWGFYYDWFLETNKKNFQFIPHLSALVHNFQFRSFSFSWETGIKYNKKSALACCRII